jgi:putative ABC transport system permease protein
METLLQDLRFGARILLRAPLITVSILLVLALGIGANAAMFGILDGLLLHSVRYPDPQTLIFVWSLDAQGALSNASPADFMDWRAKSKTVSDPAAWLPTSFVFLGGERPRQLGGARVTANFFRTLRVKPLLGRTFLPDEDGLEKPANAARSVIISYRLWQEDLGADPNVLGRMVRVDSVPYSVVGVMPPDFQFWWRPHDLWVPASLNVHERDYRNLVVVARTSAPRPQVVAEMDVIARSLAETYPKSDKGWTILVEDFRERLLNQTFRARLLLLSGAVGLVLLIACTNVAGLLLGRSAARNRELAVRASLGATGRRLGQQLLTESALLAFAGGGLGLALAWWLIRAIPKFVPPSAVPRSIELSAGVIWFCLAASVLTCLLVGLAPALSAARSEAFVSLKDSARGTTAGRARQRFRQVLVAGEVALALILLAGAWLMVTSLRALTGMDLGFDAHNVLTLRVVLPAPKYDAIGAVGFSNRALSEVAALPGVKSATFGTTLPLANSMMVRFDREDSLRDEAQQPSALYAAIGVDYFQALKVPLERGRFFTEGDNERGRLVAIISEAIASRYFPDQDPIGRQMIVYRPIRLQGEEMVKVEIVGVVGNINLSNFSIDARPMIYAPFAQNPFARGVQFAVRTNGNPAAVAASVRSKIAAIDRDQPVEQVGSLEQMLSAQFAQPRFQTELMGAFALLALLLAAVGIYGVNAYAVTQRRNEIGVRMALGATRGAVLRHVIGQGMVPTAIGIAVGLAGALAMTTWLKSLLVDAGKADPLAFAGAAVALGVVAVLACYFPARRAVRIDPAITLRME